MQNVKKVVDDMLVHDEKYDDHFHRVRQLLLKCRENGITLNPEKFTFAEEKVKYIGYLIISKGVEADLDKISTMMNHPKPSNITELRSFMGMVNQLSDFTKKLVAPRNH